MLTVLAGALGGLVESSLRPALRCAVAEALLYLQAAGYATAANFSPAKLVQAGGGGSAAWTGGMQDALLTGASCLCVSSAAPAAGSPSWSGCTHAHAFLSRCLPF